MIEEYWNFERLDGFRSASVERQLNRLISEPHLGAAWIAHHGSAPVGYLLAAFVFSLEHLGVTAEIDELYVRRDARSAGIGHQLLDTAESAFAAAGCTLVSLRIATDNASGHQFYARGGYATRANFGILEKPL